jgi:rSAM/selenodomain-associated transferase 2
MNAGAAIAKGEVLIFLHADTLLPPKALNKIGRVLENEKYVGGAFSLGIDSDRLLLKYVAAHASMRSRINRIPYGDQAIFIRKSYFDKIGKFKEIPLMEDVDLMRRIKKRDDKIYIFRDQVMTSPRRWEKEGLIYTTIRNRILMSLYFLGVGPEKLVKYYRRHSE